MRLPALVASLIGERLRVSAPGPERTQPDAHECEGCPRLRRSAGAGLRR
jgi:hypothetical protein